MKSADKLIKEADKAAKKAKCWICKRIREGSTWASIGAPIGVLGTQLPSPYNYYAYTLAAACAIAGIILSDKAQEIK